MKLFLITNSPEAARIAEESGVDRIMVDLEINGKIERQGHLNTVISHHQPSDVSSVREVLSHSELTVRCNPLFDGSGAEIDDVIARGAQRIMLPMFRSAFDAERFVELVAGRAKTTLLVETGTAIARLPQIAELSGVDDIHIGLNDLHLDLGLNFMFELLSEGLLDHVSAVMQEASRDWGFGGVAPLGEGLIPAQMVLSEHKRLGSSQVILSRDFSKLLSGEPNAPDFAKAVTELRAYCAQLEASSDAQLQECRKEVQERVRSFVSARLREATKEAPE